jgi:AcrR family transcriptional regulator
MNVTRTYRQTARAAAREETRRRIVDAAFAAFTTDWYDEVTLNDIAVAAGVTVQTVINHFGGKAGLLPAVVERFGSEIRSRLFEPAAGDLPALVAALVDDYEVTGDTVIRMLALEDRVPDLAPHLATGRASHRSWCERMIGATGERLPLAITVTDVYTWKLLRRDQGLSRDDTVRAILRLVTAVMNDRRS